MANDRDPKSKRAPALIGVFELLAQQHRELKALFDEVLATKGSRAALWLECRRQLVAHERSEVRELWPVLRAIPATRAIADHHDAEARESDGLIVLLNTLPPDSERWLALFAQLANTVTAHAAEEEAKLFPQAQEAVGEAFAVYLAGPVLKTKHAVADQMVVVVASEAPAATPAS